MKFIQYYLDCLSHASYLIADETTGRAVVVDPQRDVAEYLADAEELGLTIELVIETHFHADFLSGHLELAKATGAKIVYSSVAETEFASMGVADGERYSLGDVTLEFRHTPGHQQGTFARTRTTAGWARRRWTARAAWYRLLSLVGRREPQLRYTGRDSADAVP